MNECSEVKNKISLQLKEQVLNLLDDILCICPDESDILLVRIFFENQVDQKILIDGFIKWIYPWKEYIKERNEKYFEENDHIFGPLPSDKVKYFKIKYQDGTFNAEDKDVIWDYFDVFISLIEKYIN